MTTSAIETTITPRRRDLGGFEVRRVLPAGKQRKMVGPFIFFDEIGPAVFSAGDGIDVRPHPHINLATVTYLFEGEIVHRDNLGFVQPIRPGDVNWMTAGRGIVHSERTGEEERAKVARLHGVQSWVALPEEYEEIDPAFFHHPQQSLPLIEKGGACMRLIAGAAFGEESPVKTLSQMFYLDVKMPAGSRLTVPDEHEERAVYPVSGEIILNGESCGTDAMLILVPGSDVKIECRSDARVMLLGGEKFDGDRHIWWNFVSSSEARIEKAKSDWNEGRFEKIPGESEFIPLPAT